MYKLLFTIGALCLVGFFVLLVILVFRIMDKKPVRYVIHGMGMCVMFAVMAFVMGFILSGVN